MDKKGFPKGDPPEYCDKLKAWWAEEMATCGLSGPVSVQHVPHQTTPEPTSTGKRLFEAPVLQPSEVATTHMYRAVIPGAPWPLETTVFTSDSGMIGQVLYHALLKCPLAGEVHMTKSIGLFSEKYEFTGVGSERFQEYKETVKRCKEALCRRYDPPLWGFHSSTKYLELKEVFVAIQNEADGCGVTLCTTVRDETAFIGRKYSLGLNKVLAALKAIEQPA